MREFKHNISIFKSFKRFNYKITKEFLSNKIRVYITNILHYELRFLYTSKHTPKNILHDLANAIMLM
jgi:hypothetical protein